MNIVQIPAFANAWSAAAVATLLCWLLIIQVWFGAALPLGRRAFVPLVDDWRDKLVWKHDGALAFWLTIAGQAITMAFTWWLVFGR